MAKLEELLGLETASMTKVDAEKSTSQTTTFSFIFFSDVVKGIANREKYLFMRDVVKFADREGFAAVYLPERHFSEFGSIYANSAVVCAYLIPQTSKIRFRTAGVSLPLHHPAEVVESWAINDILSGGRVDLGFGSGWSPKDFILAPENYENRRTICAERIELVKRLWRGEILEFAGPGGEKIPIQVYPRPIQEELNVWYLVAQNDDSFFFAGKQGYNVFTMLYGIDLAAMSKKIALYRQGRAQAGLDPATGIVSLMLHTYIHRDKSRVERSVEKPFKEYINSTIDAHVNAGLGRGKGVEQVTVEEREKILLYSYQRYYKTAALFGDIEDGRRMVDGAIGAGVNDIVCLVDFGVDYDAVMESLPYLQQLTSYYQ
jgi:natural product biosynthesis luciferase-like monooxygenase protein